MKQIIAIIVFCLCFSELAARKYSNHEWGIHFGYGFGESLIEGQYIALASLGGNYSYFFSTNFGISTGLEVIPYSDSKNVYRDSEVPIEKIFAYERYSPGAPITNYLYGLDGDLLFRTHYDGLVDRRSTLLLQLPLMLQFQTPIYRTAFYLGGGFKFGIPIESYTSLKADSRTTTVYSEYTGVVYKNMPAHGLTTTQNISLPPADPAKTSIIGSVETGFKVNKSIGTGTMFLYFVLYFDYGTYSAAGIKFQVGGWGK